MWIRSETDADHAAIRRVVEAAFAQAPHASGTEAQIVDTLRRDEALTVSLVADIDGRIAGHVAASPVTIAGADGWHGLGPVAVAPQDQGHGVGSALVQAALAELRAAGSQGCVVLGEPRYYARFGFEAVPGLTYPDAPPEYFMALAFGDSLPQGAVAYHAAFASDRD
ncbi:MAG TPA: N-acetyltransferase [Xanthomonadaceae bacterium]|nr:N-acetyltransferase [Xanthomonadaceae bacterium]